MENIRKRQGKQHKNTRSTFEVGSKAGKEVPPGKRDFFTHMEMESGKPYITSLKKLHIFGTVPKREGGVVYPTQTLKIFLRLMKASLKHMFTPHLVFVC